MTASFEAAAARIIFLKHVNQRKTFKSFSDVENENVKTFAENFVAKILPKYWSSFNPLRYGVLW